MSTFLLVDAFSLAFRAYYAFPTSITHHDGSPLNMVYGFVSLLYKAIDTFQPDYLAICFDRKEPTFRHTVFSEYKAHRPPAPDEFLVQVDVLKSVLADLNCPMLSLAGFEADDLMGTLSLLAENEGVNSVLLTGDQDAFQLVSSLTKVATNQKGKSELLLIDADAVAAKLGVTPSQIVDYKALRGDASDNIPGVKGVGDKTAVKLLNAYKTLEGVYQSLHYLESKSIRSKLRDQKESAFLSYRLAKIDRHVPVASQLADFAFKVDWEASFSVFETYQFKRLMSLYSKQLASFSTMKARQKGVYRCIDSEVALDALLPELKKGFSFDLETTSLIENEAQIVGFSFAIKSGEAYYIACNETVTEQALEETVSLFSVQQKIRKHAVLHPLLRKLKPLLEDVSVEKVTHNGKYDALVFLNYGLEVRGIVFDTMIAAFLLFPGEKIGLKDLAYRYLQWNMTSYSELVGEGKKAISFSELPLDQATEYAAADADATFQLREVFSPKLKEKNLWSLFSDIEMLLQHVLIRMEYEGVCLDQPYLRSLDAKFSARIKRLSDEVFDSVGQSFNIASTKQLADILYDHLNLPVLKKTKTGRSTDSSVLNKLRVYHPIIDMILEIRTLSKLLNTYVASLPHMVSSQTGRIHTSFNQTTALTGRLSSLRPNLQNIPIRSEAGQSIRAAFVPVSPEDWIVSADYSQIELRILAQLSQDENMIQTFLDGKDIHQSTAAIIFKVPLEEVTKEQRYRAKAVNFGIIYGVSSFGLSENLGIPKAEAQATIDDYFGSFPKIKQFMDETVLSVRETGVVRTEFGRLRFVPDINSRVFHRRQFSERMAINTRVQGTAADIIKLAMIQIQDEIEKQGYVSRLLIQVHDELVFNVISSEREAMAALIRGKMEGVVSYSIPLAVDIEQGKNWLEMSALGVS